MDNFNDISADVYTNNDVPVEPNSFEQPQTRELPYSQEAEQSVIGSMFIDAEAIAALSSLEGIGIWTAEMLLLFCLGRSDVLSYGDLAIHRGMRMVYHHRRVTREMFERYRRRFSPYGSVASLYLWAISHMDVPGYERDYAPKKARSAKEGKSGDGMAGERAKRG